MKNTVFGLLILLTISAFSCEKEEVEINECTENTPEISHEEITECFQKTEWNEASIEQTLTGKWERVYMAVVGESGICLTEDDQSIVIAFSEDHMFELIVDNEVIHTTTWSLSVESGYRVELAEEDAYYGNPAAGSIAFCNDYVEFYNSAYDGPDYLYKRTN